MVEQCSYKINKYYFENLREKAMIVTLYNVKKIIWLLSLVIINNNFDIVRNYILNSVISIKKK